MSKRIMIEDGCMGPQEVLVDTALDYEPWYEMFSRQVRNMAPPDFPKIVCLCGSTRFGDAYREANKRLTLEGRIVLSVGMLGHAEGLDMNDPTKAMLDRLHKQKIDLADEILVLNCKLLVCTNCRKHYDHLALVSHSGCCGAPTAIQPYIGDSTRSEIAHALKRGKIVRYLESPTC